MAKKSVRDTHNIALRDPEVAAEYLREALESGEKAMMETVLLNIADAYKIEIERAIGERKLKGSVTQYDEPNEPVWPTGVDS